MCRYRLTVLDVGAFLEPYNHTQMWSPSHWKTKVHLLQSQNSWVKRPKCKACVYACSVVSASMDCSPPGSSVHRISQTRILEWVAISSSRGSSWLRDRTCISFSFCIYRQILYHWAAWRAHPPHVSFGKHRAHCVLECKMLMLEGIW